MDYLHEEEVELLIEIYSGDKKLTSMPKIPMCTASDFKNEDCTACTMYELGLVYTKSMIEDIETMTMLVGNVSNLRNKVN